MKAVDFFSTLRNPESKPNSLKSKESKINYPSKWNIKVLDLGIDVTVTPSVSNQELNLHHLNQLSYWEGRCFVNGSHSGFAYVELVGYEEHQ